MKAYSLDLRRRVVQAYEQGEGSISESASRFGACPAFVKKMLRQWRESGDLTPLPHGGGKPASLTPRQRQLLKRKVREQSDISLAELQSLREEREEIRVHVSTISRALTALGLPLKKEPDGGRAQQLQARRRIGARQLECSPRQPDRGGGSRLRRLCHLALALLAVLLAHRIDVVKDQDGDVSSQSQEDARRQKVIDVRAG
jgi:transposase